MRSPEYNKTQTKTKRAYAMTVVGSCVLMFSVMCVTLYTFFDTFVLGDGFTIDMTCAFILVGMLIGANDSTRKTDYEPMSTFFVVVSAGIWFAYISIAYEYIKHSIASNESISTISIRILMLLVPALAIALIVIGGLYSQSIDYSLLRQPIEEPIAQFNDKPIALTHGESKNLIKHLIHPNPDALKKRDEFISDIKNITYHEDGKGFSVELENFDTSFLDELAHTRRNYFTDGVLLSDLKDLNLDQALLWRPGALRGTENLFICINDCMFRLGSLHRYDFSTGLVIKFGYNGENRPLIYDIYVFEGEEVNDEEKVKSDVLALVKDVIKNQC